LVFKNGSKIDFQILLQDLQMIHILLVFFCVFFSWACWGLRAGQVPIPPRDFLSNPLMIIIRSFDVNKPGEEIEKLKGGVAGGSIHKGVLRFGDEIEIRPGIVSKDASGNVLCKPIRSRIMSLAAEQNSLQYAVPGGLIGVGTKIDPALTRGDRLVGHLLGHPQKLPEIYIEIEVKFYLLRRLLGVKTEGDSKAGKVSKLKKGEILMVNIGSTAAGGRILGIKENDLAKIVLTNPVCGQLVLECYNVHKTVTELVSLF